jgi:hypothetical protein
MKLRALLALSAVAASVLLSGCLGFLPAVSDEPISGRKITRVEANFIMPGSTTRAEVVQKLGKAYSEFPRVPAIAYSWESPSGTGFLLNPMDSQARTHDLTSWRALFLAFDSSGVVARKEFVHLRKGHPLVHHLEKWVGSKPR